MMIRLVIFIILITVLFRQSNCHFVHKQLPKLLVISFDGFRHDYIDMASKKDKNVSAFRTLMTRGVHAKYSIGVFPSSTFASHTSMATGLYVEEHGIVSNNFYDPHLKNTFYGRRNQTFESRWWNNGDEPIWITNERQGHHSAVINWVGLSAFYNGRLPTYSNLAYQKNYKFNHFVDRMIPWLELEHTTLGMLYSEEPDHTGHSFGPDSPEILDQIEKANSRLAYVLESVEKSKVLRKSLNIMLVSDHGMTSLKDSQSIDMDKILDSNLYHTYSYRSPLFWALWPKEKNLDTILTKLEKEKHLLAWKKENVPNEFHYSKHFRIAPIIVVTEEGWWMKTNYKYATKGSHGYNNSYADMHPIFMAAGPAFKRNVTVESIRMIDYYSLMCAVLDLHPSPNNGSLERVKFLLMPEEENKYIVTSTFITYIIVLVFVMVISGIFTLAALQQIRCHYIRRRGHPPGRMAFHELQRMENGEHTTALLREGSLDEDELSGSIDLNVLR